MNAKELGNMPAYPGQVKQHGENTVEVLSIGGLTKREAFVMAVSYEQADSIIGTYARDAADFLDMPPEDYKGEIHYPQAIAKAKVMFADALLAELAKELP